MISQTFTEARAKVGKITAHLAQVSADLDQAEKSREDAHEVVKNLMAARNAAMLAELMAGGLWLDLEVAAQAEGAL